MKRSGKQISHPTFYLFDAGFSRALSGRLPYSPTQEELGPLLENMICNETGAYLTYRKVRYQLFFWRNYDGIEVVLICQTRNGFVAIKTKAPQEWPKRFNRGLNRIQIELSPAGITCHGIHRGQRAAKFYNIDVSPVPHFLKMFWDDGILQ